jgi:hypothetical protein
MRNFLRFGLVGNHICCTSFDFTAKARRTGRSMKRFKLTTILLAAACSSAAPRHSVAPIAGKSSTAELAALHDRHLVRAISSRVFTHQQYWDAVSSFTTGPINKAEVGRSAEGRPLYLLTYGQGATRVLLWSQMHGDESTASMAVADLLRYLHNGDERTRRWAERLTIHMVPMLNPDGAERFQRENALAIDVNRDARMQATPEGRTLKAVRDRFQPQFGFNLHDQNVRTRVGNTNRTAAISLLAPPFDATGAVNDVRRRAQQIAAVIRRSVEPLVGAHITKYDESFNPRAFGDLMQQWGTSTVLIESGGWRGDPDKQHLRKANFVALVAAFDAIADGSYRNANVADYESLPPNGRAARDLIIRGGTVVIPGLAPYRADIAIDLEEVRPDRSASARIAEVGDLAEVQARDTVDASGLYVHPTGEALGGDPGETRFLKIGGVGSVVITRTAEPGSERIYTIERGRRR